MKENVNKLIETLNLLKIQITEVENKENLLKTFVIEVLVAPEFTTASASTTTTKLSEKTSELTQRQLSTLSQSLSIVLTATVSNDALTLPNILRNQV